MNRQWYRFLAEQQKRDFLVDNCNLILDILEMEKGGNETAATLVENQQVSVNQLIFFLKRIKADHIFRDYEIDKFLGAGAVGFAFSLKEPHENYVLKFQVVEVNETLGKYGTDYPEEVFSRQQQGEYRKGELNVLESKKGFGKIDSTNGIIDVQYAIFVYSKVSQRIFSGKTGKISGSEEAFSDIYDLQFIFRVLIDNRIDDDIKVSDISNLFTSWRYRLPLKNQQILERAAKTIVYKFKTRGIKSVAAYIYNFYRALHLSKEQFVNMAEEYFRQIERSEKERKPLDFHGGNFGFRQGSDEPISFDV